MSLLPRSRFLDASLSLRIENREGIGATAAMVLRREVGGYGDG